MGEVSELGDAFGAVEKSDTTKAKSAPRGDYGKTAAEKRAPAADKGGDDKGQRVDKAASDDPEHDDLLARLAGDEGDDDEPDDKGKGRAHETDEDDQNDEDDPDKDDEDEDDDEDKPKAREPLTVELKVNGESRTLTFEQLKDAASKGLSANERWQQAATTQKRANDLASQLTQERAQVATLLANVQNHMRALIQSETPNLDELAVTDPAAWVRQKHLLEQRQQHIRDAEAATAYLARQEMQQRQSQQGTFLEDQYERVLEALPDFRTPEKAKAAIGRMNTLLASVGFSNQEIEGIADHRIVKLLHTAVENADKAAKYDQLRAKANAAKKRVQNLPPARVEEPGMRQPKANARAEQRKRDVKRWEQNPNVENLSRLF
jgi:hypothetical protein